jgi:Holliday junction resolvase RusA-like endonuclease
VIQIQIPLSPVPASRPRVTKRGISYYAEPYKSFKAAVKEAFKERYGGELIDYLVNVTIVCFVEAPANSKLQIPKPDWDNYAKAVCDGMNGTVLTDDSLIHQGACTKFWAAKGEPGRIHVYIERAEIKPFIEPM